MLFHQECTTAADLHYMQTTFAAKARFKASSYGLSVNKRSVSSLRPLRARWVGRAWWAELGAAQRRQHRGPRIIRILCRLRLHARCFDQATLSKARTDWRQHLTTCVRKYDITTTAAPKIEDTTTCKWRELFNTFHLSQHPWKTPRQ